MASARRIGAPDAKNRVVLLDAAEQLMLEEGYAAVTSRRVAEKAGLKPQLVHYYFRTMDDLFLAVFRRRAEQGLEAQAQALESPQPLWALWRFSTDPAATRLTWSSWGWPTTARRCSAEIARLRASVFREEQTKALTDVLRALRHRHVATCPPVVWTFFATSAVAGAGVRDGVSGCRAGTPRSLEFLEDHDSAARGRAAAATAAAADGSNRSPAADRAERALGPLIGGDDVAVDGEHAVEVRCLRGVETAMLAVTIAH